MSGSGKSSLVFDTIAAEAQRQLNETFTVFVQGFLPRYGQPDVDRIEHLNAPIIIDQKRVGGGSRSTVGTYTDIAVLLRLLFSRVGQPYVGAGLRLLVQHSAGHVPGVRGHRQDRAARSGQVPRPQQVAERRGDPAPGVQGRQVDVEDVLALGPLRQRQADRRTTPTRSCTPCSTART